MHRQMIYLGMYVKLQLNELEAFLVDTENALQSRCDHLVAQLSQEAAALPEAEREQLLGVHGKDFRRLTESFPHFLRDSFLLSSFSLFEHGLERACDHVRNALGIALPQSELRGSGIARAQTYLKKLAGMPFPDHVPEWNEIVHYEAIRNLIAHCDGVIERSRDKEKLRMYVLRKQGVLGTVPGLEHLELSEAFCVEMVATLRAFFDLLTGKLAAAILARSRKVGGSAPPGLRQSRGADSGEAVPCETADGADFRADYADTSSIQPTSNLLLTLGS
ncbi:MAG: hypothetical protein HYX75_02655, partial [Acidobacteria bacterium]|nr:hypothetical protein [Acidobacteriota bacterium]